MILKVLSGLLFCGVALAAKTQYTAVILDTNTVNDRYLVKIKENGEVKRQKVPSLPTKLEKGLVAVTNDPVTGKMYMISGGAAGEQKLLSVCGDETEKIKISPSRVNLRCLSSGPNGVTAYNLRSKNIGKIDVTTGEWSPLSRLTGPYDQRVLAQFNGGFTYINGNGRMFVSPSEKMKLEKVKGDKFNPEKPGICGEQDGENHIVSVTMSNGLTNQGITRFNLNNQKVKLWETIPATYGYDITVGEVPEKCIAPTSAPKK